MEKKYNIGDTVYWAESTGIKEGKINGEAPNNYWVVPLGSSIGILIHMESLFPSPFDVLAMILKSAKNFPMPEEPTGGKEFAQWLFQKDKEKWLDQPWMTWVNQDIVDRLNEIGVKIEEQHELEEVVKSIAKNVNNSCTHAPIFEDIDIFIGELYPAQYDIYLSKP